MFGCSLADYERRVKGESMLGINDEELCQAIDTVVPDGVTHIGMVLHDVRGNIVIRQSNQPKYGVSASIPRWKREGTEPAVALKSCVAEHIGLQAASVYPLPQVWVTDNSSTFYFVGVTRNPDAEPALSSSEAKWCDKEEAFRVIAASKNATSRNRDLAVLESSANVVPSSFRRILLVLSELHQMGFGRLRASTWMYQNGYIEPPGRWSCAIVPSVVMKDDHGAMTDGERENELRSALEVIQHHDPWMSTGGQPPFGWSGMCFAPPRVVAEQFLSKFRDLCFIGWGQDPAYQRWYDEMLSATAPYGVFYPIVSETEYVMAAYTGVENLRLPPPPIARG